MASFKKITGKITGVFKRETRAQNPAGDTKPAYGLPPHVAAFLAECPQTPQPPAHIAQTAEELAATEALAGYSGFNPPRRATNLRLV